MKFNISNIHTIYESFEESKVKDQVGANLDNIMANSDILSVFDNICPISGNVYAAMKGSAADPKNLKIAMTTDSDGEHSLFIEAVEFMTFCEASDMDEGEAAKKIIDSYEGEIPGLGVQNINVVFPNDSLNKNILGGENRGINTRNDWAMRLMRGCYRYGLTPRVGVEDHPLNEFTESEKNIKGVQITISGESEYIDTAIDLANKHWDKIVDEAAERMFTEVKWMNGKNGRLQDKIDKYKSAKNLAKYLKCNSAIYTAEDFMSKGKLKCGLLHLSFDTNPPFDRYHMFTLTVYFKANNTLTFESVYEG